MDTSRVLFAVVSVNWIQGDADNQIEAVDMSTGKSV
jgi:hypothetical protein